MFRADSRAAKIGVVIVELAGVLIAVAAAGAALLYWRLQAGPVSLSFFEASAEYAIRQALPEGLGVDIKSATLTKSAEPGRYDLSLEKIIISNPQKAAIAELSLIELEFRAEDLIHRRFGPHSVIINDAAFTIERGLDRSIKLESAPTAGKKSLFRLLTGGERFRKSLDHAELRNARIRFHDAATDRSWLAAGAAARIDRTQSGYQTRLAGDFDVEGAAASLSMIADYTEKTGVTDAAIDVVKAPVGDILETFYGGGAAILSAPVSGRLSLRVSRSGAILASRIEAHVEAGELRLSRASAPIDFIDLRAAFDPASNSFDVTSLAFAANGSHGAIRGSVSILLPPAAPAPLLVRFDLAAKDLLIDAKEALDAPLSVSSAEFAGVYDIAARRLTAERVAAHFLDVDLAGALDLATSPGASPQIKGRVAVAGALDPARVLAGWPKGLGESARGFVAARLLGARIENIVFDVDLPAGALVAGQPTPDEAFSLTFDVSEAAAIYSPGMTPLSHASGKGRLSGNRFVINAIKGRVGAVAISEGEIDFTALSPAGEPAYYRFTAEGAASDMLGILNEEPLALLKDTDLAPSRFVGKATVRATISRPNRNEVPRDQYGYSGRADFADLTLLEFFGGVDLSRARGSVKFDTRSMLVEADAALGESPVKIAWRNHFYAADGPSRFHVTGEVDSSTGDIFGIPTRQLLRGPVSFAADAVGDLGGVDELAVSADFSRTTLLFDAFGWRKQPDIAASGALDLAFNDNGVEVRALELSGDGMMVKGAARFGPDGVIERFAIDRFFLDGAAEFAASGGRTESGLLDITLTGPLLSAGGLIQSVVEDGGRPKPEGRTDWGAGVVLRGRIDEVRARGQAVYQDATLDFRHGRQRMEALEFSARTAGGKPLSVVLKETGTDNGPRQVIEARTDDIGSLLSGIFAIGSVRGGEGYMELLNGGAEAGGLAGVLEARNLRVVGAPLLARIFAAGSLDGLADLLNGEGISLTKAYGRFGFADGVVSIDEARATGPSVGITGAGRITAGEGGAVVLNGAIAPAYQVNSLLGKTPIIGDIFVNREGEGVVALAYDVSGRSDAPMVTVNPLSALTPGFLRRMFEGPETTPAPPAGEAPAAPQSVEEAQ